jgi:endogenous inhibitor of DNA gyrase (YacG/DUF329 family)
MRCPVCKRETAWKGNPFRPFCSERCKLIDLGNWLAERYRINVAEDEKPMGDPSQPREAVEGDCG